MERVSSLRKDSTMNTLRKIHAHPVGNFLTAAVVCAGILAVIIKFL